MSTETSVEMTTYLIEFSNGKRQRITVPSTWKVTFGPAARGNNGTSSYKEKLTMPMALRFYESDTKQRAIFTDVVSFRDTSIAIEEERQNVQEKDGYMECDGRKKRVSFQAKTREWINPDETPESQPMLPADGEIFDMSDITDD